MIFYKFTNSDLASLTITNQSKSLSALYKDLVANYNSFSDSLRDFTGVYIQNEGASNIKLTIDKNNATSENGLTVKPNEIAKIDNGSPLDIQMVSGGAESKVNIQFFK